MWASVYYYTYGKVLNNMLLEKFIPRILKDFLRGRIEQFISQSNRLRLIEEKLEKLTYDVQTIHPPNIIQDDRIQNIIKIFRDKNKIPLTLNTIVSKNDIMFRYILQQSKKNAKKYEFVNTGFGYSENYAAAYFYSLEGSLHSVNVIRKLVNHHIGDMRDIVSFLDFGCGYSGISRFLVLDTNPKNVWVCDRKWAGVQFVVKQFGVNGFLSPIIPEDFPKDREYSVIYAGSVFSHLPSNLFLRWLQVLYNLISENGILIITVHDISLVPLYKNEEHYFIKGNEDIYFREVSDRIVGVEDYGTTYVSENFVSQQLRKIGVKTNQYCRYPKGLANLQDIYIISKKRILDNQFDFSSFP